MQTVPDRYADQDDPGDEEAQRHATRLEPKLWLRASVYRFGRRWHWKCGPRDKVSRCGGGSAQAQAQAYAMAERHLTDEHNLTFRVHDAANCWCDEDPTTREGS